MKTHEFVTDIKVGGKTPEEIKNDAATRLTRPQNSECNRFELYKECAGDCRYVIKELYDLVLYYEARLAQAEREREAAVADLSNSCAYCKHTSGPVDEPPCAECFQPKNNIIFAPITRTKFEWRGVCQENTKEATRK